MITLSHKQDSLDSGINISEMKPESGKVKSVVYKFYINWGKEENVGYNAPRK